MPNLNPKTCLSVYYTYSAKKSLPKGLITLFLILSMSSSYGQFSANSLEHLSYEFLKNAKRGESNKTFATRLSATGIDDSLRNLDDEKVKATIWINLYNAFVIELLLSDKSLYNNRSKFFKMKKISIGNRTLSLNDIEHGLLRKSSIWWSQGRLKKPFPSAWEKNARMNQLDWRVHFALNCGALSCPPIVAYKSSLLDQQLNLATKNYLQQCKVDNDKKTVWVPKLFYWYKADFGGKKGIMHILIQYKIIDDSHKGYQLRYLDYDWKLASLTD